MTQWFWESRPGDKTVTTHTTNIPIVTTPRPRPTRAQAMAAVSELQDAEFSFALYTKQDGKARKVRQRAKAKLIAIIEALTEEDEFG